MTTHPPRSYSPSSISSDSLLMLTMQDDDDDAVAYRERNIYDNDRGYHGGRHQGGAGGAGEGGGGRIVGRGRSWSVGDSRFLPSQSTQASAPSPGGMPPSPNHHHHDYVHQLPRHERKRRVKAIEEADRADAQQQAHKSPASDGEMSPPPPPWSGDPLSRHHLPGNPFADLEEFVVRPKEQEPQQHEFEHESRGSGAQHDDFYVNDDREEVHDERSVRPAPTSSQKKRKTQQGGDDGEADAATTRQSQGGIGRHSPSLPSGLVHPYNPRRGNDRDAPAAKLRRGAPPEWSRPARRHELSDRTNGSASSRPAEISSRRRTLPPPSGRVQGYLDGPPRSTILDHSRRQFSKAARRPLNKDSMEYVDRTTSTASDTSSRRAAVVRASSRSIVGSRPTHWGTTPRERSGAVGPDPATTLSSFNQLQKARLADVLDRRQRPRLSAVSARPQPPSDPALHRVASHPTQTSTDPAPAVPAERELAANSSSSLAPVSFAPSFLTRAVACVSATKEDTQGGEDVDDAVLVVADDHGPGAPSQRSHSPYPTGTGVHWGSHPAEGPLSPPPSSPAPKGLRRKNHPRDTTAGGALVRRLKSLRDAVKADSIRLQSGQYGAGSGGAAADRWGPTSLFIMNDPRTKAESCMDVTLVSPRPVLCDSHHEKLTYLAYCHDHRVKNATLHGAGRLVDDADADPSNRPPSCSSKFVWLCVTFATAREWGVASVTQLRIYNPIVVTMHLDDDSTNPSSASMGESAAATNVRYAVLSTYLCEPYPDGSPKLPEPPTLPVARLANGGQNGVS